MKLIREHITFRQQQSESSQIPASNSNPIAPPNQDEDKVVQEDETANKLPALVAPTTGSFEYNSVANNYEPSKNAYDKPYKEKACVGACKEMAYCLTQVQKVLNERKKKELIKKDPSAKDHISCDIGGSYFKSSVWYIRYPVEGNCYDTRKGLLGSSFSFMGPEDISDSEKSKRVKDCNSHLNKLKAGQNPKPPAPAKRKPVAPEPYDPKAEKMAKCLEDIQTHLIKDKKRQLSAKGVSSENINCTNDLFLANSDIWNRGVELPQPKCWEKGKPVSVSVSPDFAYKIKPVTEAEKDEKLSWCQNQLKELMAKPEAKYSADGVEIKESDPKDKAFAECRTATQKLLTDIEYEKLVSEGSKPMNIFCEKQVYLPYPGVFSNAGYPSGICYDTTNKKPAWMSGGLKKWRHGGPTSAEKDHLIYKCILSKKKILSLKSCMNTKVTKNGNTINGRSCVSYKDLLSMPEKSTDQQIVMVENCNKCLGLEGDRQHKETQGTKGQR